MQLNKKPYKGTRDFPPQQQRIQNYLFEKMHACATSYAFEPYNGPLLEELDLYRAKSGDELVNEQLYSFTDKGNRELAIRPEMTPTLARMIAANHKELSKPIRWYSIPNLMRYERPQRGRLREHFQFNCDIFGGKDNYAQYEVLSLAVSLLNSFGASHEHFSIRINDRRLVDDLLRNQLSLDEDKIYKVYKIIDKSKKISKSDLSHELEQLKIEEKKLLLINDYLLIDSLARALDFFKFSKEYHVLERFILLVQGTPLEKYIQYDPCVIRGLDYYTGLVFEIFDKHPDNNRALCGGGAYADLLKIFGEDKVPGVGFGLGDLTLKNFLETHGLLPDFSQNKIDLYIASQNSELSTSRYLISIASYFRSHGLKVCSGYEAIKINKALKEATKQNAKFIIYIGEEEHNNKTVLIKNLQTRTQEIKAQAEIEQIHQFISSKGTDNDQRN